MYIHMYISLRQVMCDVCESISRYFIPSGLRRLRISTKAFISLQDMYYRYLLYTLYMLIRSQRSVQSHDLQIFWLCQISLDKRTNGQPPFDFSGNYVLSLRK